MFGGPRCAPVSATIHCNHYTSWWTHCCLISVMLLQSKLFKELYSHVALLDVRMYWSVCADSTYRCRGILISIDLLVEIHTTSRTTNGERVRVDYRGAGQTIGESLAASRGARERPCMSRRVLVHG